MGGSEDCSTGTPTPRALKSWCLCRGLSSPKGKFPFPLAGLPSIVGAASSGMLSPETLPSLVEEEEVSDEESEARVEVAKVVGRASVSVCYTFVRTLEYKVLREVMVFV